MSFDCFKKSSRTKQQGSGSSNAANTFMVPNYDIRSCSSTNYPSTIQEFSESSCISRGNPSTAQKNESPYLSTVRQQLEDLGFTSRSIAVIVASWRDGTTSQCQTYLQKWLEFCKQKHCDVLSPPLPLTLDFFVYTVREGFILQRYQYG